MDEFDLSIIIPHYNRPKRLDILLNTIYLEADDRVQVIVVDDNSDKYLEKYNLLISKYDKAVFVKNSSLQKGAGSARNIGLEYASGKWMLFADSDDYFEPGWYSCVSKYFKSFYDMVFF